MMTISSKDLEGEWKQKLDGHLKAPDFFNVDSFPTAKLAIKSFDGINLNADLTIKEVTKTISVPASVSINDGNLEGSAEFAINRTDYGVVYGSDNFFELAKDKVISDEIKFKFLIKANR
jgi:polyisoprenoid-binding protein YceI